MLGRIAVHVDRDPHCAQRVQAAAALAARHDAELVGVYASFVPSRYGHSPLRMPHTVEAMFDALAEAQTAELEDLFHQEANAAQIASSWHATSGSPEDALIGHARYCDLLVLSQPDTQSPGPTTQPEQVASILLAVGRPVLMIPSIGLLAPIGSRVLLAWDGGRPAARALADAAPLLLQAEELVILTVDPDQPRDAAEPEDWHELVAYCAARGYALPRPLMRWSDRIGVGNVMLNTAADQGSDLIVMGVYGHSRLRESLLGGASRTLLSSMTVPVLFSH